MSFVIPVIIYIILFIAIVTLHIFALKSSGKLFWIIIFILEPVSSFISFFIMTYYDALNEAAEKQIASGLLTHADKLPYETYTMVCLLAAILFLGMIFLTGIVIIARELIRRKR